MYRMQNEAKEYRLQNTGYSFVDTEYGIQLRGYRIRDTVTRIQNTGYSYEDTEYGIQLQGYRIRTTVTRIQNTDYSYKDTEYGIQLRGYRIRDTVTRVQNKFGCGFRQKKDLSYFGSEPNSFLEKIDSGSTTLYCIIVDVCKSLGYPKVVVGRWFRYHQS